MKTIITCLALLLGVCSAKAATLIVRNSSSVPTSIILPNVPNTVLGGIDVVVTSEPVSVTGNLSFNVGPNPITNLRLWDTNSLIVVGPADSINGIVAFTDIVTFPVGTNTYRLVGTLNSSATNSPIVVTTTPSSDWRSAVGAISGNAVSLQNELVKLNRMVIYGYSTGTAIYEIASITNGQSNTRVSFRGVSGYNSSLQESVDLNNWQYSTNVAGIVSAGPDNTGEMMTSLYVFRTNRHLFFRLVERPVDRLTITTDSTSPERKMVAAGYSDVTVGVYRLHANIESVRLNQIGLALGPSCYPGDITSLTLWDGTTQIGSAIFVGTNRTVTVLFPSALTILKDSDKAITVKVNLAFVSPFETGKSGDLVTIDYDGIRPERTVGVGVISGQTITASGATAVAGVRMFRSIPSVRLEPLPASGVADGRLLRFSIRADDAGNVSIGKFSFMSLFGTNVSIGSAKLHGYFDSNYSVPVSYYEQNGALAPSVVITNGVPWSIYPRVPNGDQNIFVMGSGFRYYFELRAPVSVLSTSATVATSLWTGDDVLNGLAPLTATEQFQNSWFVWSPNSLDSSWITDQDWWNSYLVPGLSNPGISQTRTD